MPFVCAHNKWQGKMKKTSSLLMFVKDRCFFLTKWHFWHTKSCLFIAFVNLPFSSVGRAECKDGSWQELWKSKKLEKKLEKLRKELENLKKLEKLKPYALLIIGGRASRSTTPSKQFLTSNFQLLIGILALCCRARRSTSYVTNS